MAIRDKHARGSIGKYIVHLVWRDDGAF